MSGATQDRLILERIAVHLRELQSALGAAYLHLPGQVEAAREILSEACDTSNTAAALLIAGGIHVGAPTPSRLDLSQLATLDSPEARELHRRLMELIPLAETVDASRGRTMGSSFQPLPGESRGTDIAETLSLLVLRLQDETVGPKGRE